MGRWIFTFRRFIITKEIAVYGKGGIGKSTICANLSAALIQKGKRVLQVGCDPKHDSTRLLIHGKRQTTVLDYMRSTSSLDYKAEDILLSGYGGIGCIEAGGPEPGVGCAGRGIISVFEFLNLFQLKEKYDIMIYDVLGDVVCGGFAVPIRSEYADTIFIVTSGEFMALYAANNILRGIRNYDRNNGKKRVAGILYNKRNIEGEDERVSRFAHAVCLPICCIIPRSDAFTSSEQDHMTVVEQDPTSMVAEIFLSLAGDLLGGCELFEAKPLEDGELECIILGRSEISAPQPHFTPPSTSPPPPPPIEEVSLVNPNRYYSKNKVHGGPSHGCAYNGAVTLSVHIQDAITLTHAPKSCTYISNQTISSPGRRRLFERGALLPISLSPNLESTEMGEAEMVFGGMNKLEKKITELKAKKPRAIIVVSACPAGIIGDDIDQIRRFSEQNLPIVTIKADGIMSGDYLQGMLMCYTFLARQIIKRDVPTVPNTVNIIFEKIVVTNTNENFEIISEFLRRMGVRVNCRFLYETSYDSLENFCSASLNLLASRDFGGSTLENFFMHEYGSVFFDMAFPIGFFETEAWLHGIGAFFGKEEVAEDIIAEHKARYEREVGALRSALAGKKLMIVTYNHDIDWILQVALDAGMKVVKICILNFSQDTGFRTRLTVPLFVEERYDRENQAQDLERYLPDILLTNYASSLSDDVSVVDTIPMCPDIGFYCGLHFVKRWERLLKLNLKGEWHQDAELCNQYHR